MSEITAEMHGQVEYEQYKVATVDEFVVTCPYCGEKITTESYRQAVCPGCNQIIQLFTTSIDAERYLDSRQERRLIEDEENK